MPMDGLDLYLCGRRQTFTSRSGKIRMRSLKLRLASLFGAILFLSACDKCGDYAHFIPPSLPKTCLADEPAQK